MIPLQFTYIYIIIILSYHTIIFVYHILLIYIYISLAYHHIIPSYFYLSILYFYIILILSYHTIIFFYLSILYFYIRTYIYIVIILSYHTIIFKHFHIILIYCFFSKVAAPFLPGTRPCSSPRWSVAWRCGPGTSYSCRSTRALPGSAFIGSWRVACGSAPWKPGISAGFIWL